MKKQVQDYMFWVYWSVAVFVACIFTLPPAFMNITNFFEVDGCWFENVRYSWIFYYGPMFVMAGVNIILGASVQTMLMLHRREMSSVGKDSESSKGQSSTQEPQGSIKSSSMMEEAGVRSTTFMTSSANGTSTQQGNQPAIRKKRNSGDELKSVAIIVNLYVAIPFICEFATAVTESLPDYGGEVGALFQTFFVSCMGCSLSVSFALTRRCKSRYVTRSKERKWKGKA
ncbi:hypothetical protein BC829DRAFT_215202 [Chytridium lagenaria]|nr:hypothetical protein BC829DRAFT_215202 [Chytridium lagenaria]